MKVFAFTVLTMLSMAGAAFGYGNVRGGTCGSLGCPKEKTNKALILAEVLRDEDVTAAVRSTQVLAVVYKPYFLEQYEVTLANRRKLCARVEYTLMPIVIDGKSSVQVEDQHILISVAKGQCKK